MQTLSELAAHFELFAVCIDCQRMVRIDLHELLLRLPSTLTVVDLRNRVRCRACGRRSRDIRIVYAGPCGNARGFHYRSYTPQSPSSSVPSNVSPKPATPT
jgi:ribosomal protein L37E